MKILKTKIPARSVATVSCVGIMCEEYPLHYGNYFSMYLNGVKLPDDMKIDKTQHNCNWFSVCNFNHENYEEAHHRFLTDNEVEITVFKPENLGWFVIAITDERIPEDWYCMWSEQQGYCNGGIHGKTYEEVARTLGKRFGGDENFKMTTTCDICGKEIIGVENFIDAGDKVVCSENCKQKAYFNDYVEHCEIGLSVDEIMTIKDERNL